MEWLYDWVWNLVIYFILLTALTGVLPRENYKKYIRLFTGAFMILIMLNPLMKLGNLDGEMEMFFRKNSFEQERRELKSSMEGMQDVGQEYVMKHYKNVLSRQIENLAEENGVAVDDVEILLEEDMSSNDYGKLLYLKMEAKGADADFVSKIVTEFGLPEENINLGADYE